MDRRLTFLLLLLLFAAPTHAGSLRGSVKNSIDLVPLSGADVTVHVLLPDSVPFPAVTGSDGSYEITGIIPGNEIYVVIAWKNGFRQSYTRVADLGAQDLLFDIILVPDTAGLPPPGGGRDSGTVAGTIYQPGAGGILSGVPDAMVKIYSAMGAALTATGPDGRYSARIPGGSFAIAVTAAGFDSLAITGLAVDSSGATVNAVVKKTITGVDHDPDMPSEGYALDQNYPNPFNPATTIRYALPVDAHVTLKVFNALGQIVSVLVDEWQDAGYRHIEWNAGPAANGVYFCRFEAVSTLNPGMTYTQVRRMLVLK